MEKKEPKIDRDKDGLKEKFHSSKTFVKKSRIPTPILAAWLGMVGVGLIITVLFAQSEVKSKNQEWQKRIVSEAANSASMVSAWAKSSFAALDGIAGNQSVQIYLEAQKSGRETPEKEAQAIFLRNLLESVSRQSGFYPEVQKEGPASASSRLPSLPAGIIIVDSDNNFVASSTGTASYEGDISSEAVKLEKNAKSVSNPVSSASNGYYVIFRVPVYAAGGQGKEKYRLGAVLGLKLLNGFMPEALSGSASLRGILMKQSEKDDNVFTALSSIDGEKLEVSTIEAEGSAKPAEAFAFEQTGTVFVARDADGKMVIASAKEVDGLSGWKLVQKIDEIAALGSANSSRNAFIAFYMLAALVVSLAAFALWKQARTLRIADAADHYKRLMHQYRQQGSLLELISNSEPSATFIVDEKLRIRFANRSASEKADAPKEELVGKTLSSAFGAAMAKPYEERVTAVLENGKPLVVTFRFDIGGQHQVSSCSFIPLHDIPDEHEGGIEKGVLVVEEDITAVITERELRERTLKRLVNTLVTVMDSRDPFAAHHSARVAKLARKLAENVGLSTDMVETAETAGRLMNIGKIMVPETLLTSSSTLKIKDISDIRTAISSSAKLLEGLEFSGPVVETVRQSQERPDGSGPLGVSESRVLPSARVVNVANSFIAMISNRAYRPGMAVDEALAEIQQAAGEAYDRHAVAALIHYVENQGGREEFAEFEQFLQLAG